MCLPCRRGEDTSQHLFIECSFSRRVYSAFGDYFGIPSVQHSTVISFLEHWFRCILVSSSFRYFPLFFFWCIWKQRNRCIFYNKQASVHALLKQIDDLIHLYPVPQKKEVLGLLVRVLRLVTHVAFLMGLLQRILVVLDL